MVLEKSKLVKLIKNRIKILILEAELRGLKFPYDQPYGIKKLSRAESIEAEIAKLKRRSS